MKIITVYQYQGWDGADRYNNQDICFEDLEQMMLFLKNRPHDLYVERKFTVYADVAEYELTRSESVKTAALAKLTDIEKQALGLL